MQTSNVGAIRGVAGPDCLYPTKIRAHLSEWSPSAPCRLLAGEPGLDAWGSIILQRPLEWSRAQDKNDKIGSEMDRDDVTDDPTAVRYLFRATCRKTVADEFVQLISRAKASTFRGQILHWSGDADTTINGLQNLNLHEGQLGAVGVMRRNLVLMFVNIRSKPVITVITAGFIASVGTVESCVDAELTLSHPESDAYLENGTHFKRRSTSHCCNSRNSATEG
ncbi:hypothetical protein CSKR_201194 [Clonorchis sinensis]|uniref:Uncharacterized protein n=1 Tax=Clonorchis sinensis TaxID=79923 RepID=A0A8T1MN96_CLOSI|nr:hypothetical protein CSKR_201194 [Clonorchis sinensis]